MLNYQALLCFLHTSVNAVCKEKTKTDVQKLHLLLTAILKKSALASDDFNTEEKGLLLGLLEQCGIAADKAIWKAEYTGRYPDCEYGSICGARFR